MQVLCLDLSQFRELEAFAQLGTELDPATQAQLDRGMRLVEILKQGQYEPLSVAEQVLIVFAGTQGFLDKVPVSRAREYEKAFLAYMNNSKSEIVKEINDTGKIESEDRIIAAVKEFTDKFMAKTGA
jgi:F-type H+/Na+-transporting ATPase subunit alpha